MSIQSEINRISNNVQESLDVCRDAGVSVASDANSNDLPGATRALASGFLPLAGGNMTGEIKTSFKGAVAIGSYQSAANTVPNLVEEVRYSSGCAGSVSISNYTKDGVTIPVGWYNFMYAPHRSGGANGAVNGDNQDYGTLLLFGMTDSNRAFRIRVSGGAISEVRAILESGNYGSYITPAGIGAAEAGNVLPLSGGTLSGALNGTAGISLTATVASANNEQGLTLKNGTFTGRVSLGNSGGLGIYAGANMFLRPGTSEGSNFGVRLTKSDMTPTTSESMSLGTSGANQYNNIYGKAIYQNGKKVANAEDIPSDYLPTSGGKMTGVIDSSGTANVLDFGTAGWFRGLTANGGRFDIFGYSNPTTLQVGGTYPALALKGKNTRPTYNGTDVALLSDVPSRSVVTQPTNPGVVSYFKISNFGNWYGLATYEKVSLLIGTRSGETILFTLAGENATTMGASALKLNDRYGKIAGIYYKISESAIYVSLAEWANILTVDVLSDKSANYNPIVEQVDALPTDQSNAAADNKLISVPIVPFGDHYATGIVIGDTSKNISLKGANVSVNGVLTTNNQTPGSFCVRNTKLAASDTNPTVNGEICWTYK